MSKYLVIFFSLILTACDPKNNNAFQVQQDLVRHSLANMVEVKGGTFKMGDFGPLINDRRPISLGDDDKFLHDVTLSDFSIGKYKVTWKDYKVYAKLKGIVIPDVVYLYQSDLNKVRADNMPASLNWQQAKNYCQWLGKATNKKIDLPTEAQWEYAARDGGKLVIYATNNGKYEPGKNLASSKQRREMTDTIINYPVGKYPSTPLGLYDMAGNGVDWTQDWYSENYYEVSPRKNPKGPDSGTKKVIRGYQSGGDEYSNQTVFRQYEDPALGGSKEVLPYYNARCVVNK
ncbi:MULTISPECIES: formylglycine-generating enzyme family protein [Pantoea]|uniref:Sulfatase-modifying factor enzyme-like domain-containing protein n=2 Tax=Pantoea TaxID=53335 RepID=A0A0U3UUT7_9GAMM|nr:MULTISPECIES: SUMF1/EgtB/PvdO family nonheme iron enzyme [Pantoea]ALV93498.1 hypothetical protein LK04_15675 [Pantoea vagans]KHJ68839.1 hypothetical protein QU24_06750 [Pantoea rodasii]